MELNSTRSRSCLRKIDFFSWYLDNDDFHELRIIPFEERGIDMNLDYDSPSSSPNSITIGCNWKHEAGWEGSEAFRRRFTGRNISSHCNRLWLDVGCKWMLTGANNCKPLQSLVVSCEWLEDVGVPCEQLRVRTTLLRMQIQVPINLRLDAMAYNYDEPRNLWSISNSLGVRWVTILGLH